MAGEAIITADFTKWTAFLTMLRHKTANANKILKAVFNVFGFKDIMEHFDKERGPEGPWAPWSEAYRQKREGKILKSVTRAELATIRQAGGGAPKILQLSGKTKQSIIPANVTDHGNSAIKVFALTEYSGQHDEGDPSKHLPKREFMWISEKASDLMLKGILDNMVDEK